MVKICGKRPQTGQDGGTCSGWKSFDLKVPVLVETQAEALCDEKGAEKKKASFE